MVAAVEWIKDINVKIKTLNFLGENIRDYCFNAEAGNKTVKRYYFTLTRLDKIKEPDNAKS